MADADVNVPAAQAPTMAPHTRTNDQIIPHIRWVPIGKSNCYLDVEKSQSNPIYKIATARCYKCQLDEQWFDLTKDTLKDALKITPVNNNKAFSSPPSSDSLINFVNELGYPKLVRNLSNIEEFTQSIHTFIKDKKNLAQNIHGKKKATFIVFLSIRFTKLIIYHLKGKHKFQLRPDSPLYLPNEELVLGYLNFSAKGTKTDVFGVPIPGNLITADIQGSDPDSPASKPTKITKKSKPTAPKAALRPRLKERSVRWSVDESVAEGIPEKEPRVDDEEADMEPESGKYQPLLEVQGKGKEKVIEELVARDHEVKFDEDVPRINAGVQGEGQAGPNPDDQDEGQAGQNPDDQDEGQAGPNPDEQAEGQARPNPGDDATSQPLPSPVVHAGPNLEHMDFEENLKLTVEEHVILEERASTTGTLSSIQHLTKEISFGDIFFNDKPLEADNEKTTIETKAESMVSVTIQLDTSAIALMTTPIVDLTSRPDTDSVLMKHIGELEHIMANLIQENKNLEERLDSHGARLYTLENLDIPHYVSKAIDEIVTDAVDWAIQVPLRNHFRDLPEADMKEILHQRMWETNSYKTYEDHKMMYESLKKSMNRDNSKKLTKDLAEARKKKKKRRDSPKMPHGSPPHQPPRPPPPAGPSRASGSPGAFRSSQVPPPPPPPPSTNQRGQLSVSLTPADLQMDDDIAPDAQAHSSDDEDIKNAHIPKVNLWKDWWKPLEEERPATPEPAWSITSSDVPVPKNNWHLLWRPPIHLLQKTRYSRRLYQMEECHKLLTDGVDDSILMHNVSKPLPLGGPPGQMKVAYYPDVGLEQMVPDQMWIEEECNYDIDAMYGISHWWFQRQRFYIDKHTSKGNHRAVRTHMRILSVVIIEVFSMYGYDYMKKIVLRRADLNEHIIAERDFNDGTLQQIDEALQYQVKEFKVNRMNPGLNTRFWTRKDVDRSK
uniref:Uncharacterized protein n=1 Tax=Tanacetum cinerariifolium TaxID=118510 RepID=A0A6L2KWF9_TANCI|nr:hypothetical protein [Tanacetum cinerariifolium]